MATLDTGHSLYPNLVYAYRDQQEYVFTATLTNTNGTLGNDVNGDYWESAGSGSYLDSTTPTLTFTPSGYDNLTFVAVGDFSTSSSYTTAASMTDADANAGWSLRAEQATSGNIGFTYLNVADIEGDLATPTGFAAIAASTQQTGTRFAVNGTSGSLISPNTANWSSGTLDTFTIGNQAASSTYNSPLVSGDKVYAVYVFDKALSAAELESITNDPDQLFLEGLALDSVPTQVNSQTAKQSQVSSPAVAPTTLNTEVKWVDDTGPAATMNSVTGSDPYGLDYTFPRTTAKLFSSTGYPLYHEVDAENVTSAGNVPYLPIATQTFVDLSSPVNTAGTLGETYAGSAAATGDQWVYDTSLTGDASITLTVDAQGYWEISGTPSVNSTAGFYRIDSTGTVDVEDTITFEVDVPPVLSIPTGAQTGSTTGSGTVTTDASSGTLYYIATTNASELLATIKAGSSQIVVASGVQNVSFTGLTPNTTYYAHYAHTDSNGDSNVESSTSFTTLEASAIPADSRTSIFHLANYLRSLETYNSTQCNELVVEWLVSEGITRTQINQMLYAYLGGLGYTGSFNDRLKAWSEDV